MAPSCTSIDNWKASVKGIYSARVTRISKAGTYWDNTFQEFHGKVKKMKNLTQLPRFPTSTVKPKSYEDKTQMFLSFAKHALPSLPRDRWRNCRLNSLNSTGSECCHEFVIFSQPMVRVTIIHDWVTTFIVVHVRFTTNGYALPVPHALNHKMDLQ